jgi:hypothetical protein
MTCALAWVFPGAGHMLQGQAGKAAIFGATLLPMFLLGLWFGGRLFPLAGSEPLVMLAGLAQWMMGAVRVVAGFADAGRGDVVAVAYEYGNTFLIVAGLLNALVVLDASDIARGRKPA